MLKIALIHDLDHLLHHPCHVLNPPQLVITGGQADQALNLHPFEVSVVRTRFNGLETGRCLNHVTLIEQKGGTG